MKKYIITKFENEEYMVNEHIGGGAYAVVFFGSYAECEDYVNNH